MQVTSTFDSHSDSWFPPAFTGYSPGPFPVVLVAEAGTALCGLLLYLSSTRARQALLFACWWLQKLAERQRPRKGKGNVYEQLHKDANAISQKMEQKRHQRDEQTLKVVRCAVLRCAVL